ncbi:hypothetical protein SK128_013250 [Halocaridina rubra]|uniref:C2H2-type domain-containing protein n=1 Tax=Halocaridina rubra TaxID=373956 RepID=A0AAN8ZXJ8_HALRR
MSLASEKKYQCPICLKSFTKPHTLKVHMRLHTGKRPHECQVCSKTFVTGSALKDHLISHVTSRDFVCSKCGAKFKHKGTLKRHQALHQSYENKRDNYDTSETLTVDESLSQPKEYTISVSEAMEKFPCLKDVLHQRSAELSKHEIISKADSAPEILKQERLRHEDDYCRASVLELTEDKSSERLKVKIYNISDKLPLLRKSTTPHSFSTKSRASCTQKADEPYDISPDLAERYGGHVSRILRLLNSQDKQAALILKMNKTLHNFIIRQR